MKTKFFVIQFLFVVNALCAQTLPKVYEALKASYEQQDFEACIKLSREVETQSKNQRDTLTVDSYFYLADAYNQLGQLNHAISWHERTKALSMDLGLEGTDGFSATLFNLADIYMQAGRYQDAGSVAQQLLANDRKVYKATSEEFVASVLSIADIFIQSDRFNETEKLLLSTIRQQPKTHSTTADY